MKKLLLSIVILSLLFSCAGAESVDLSALSFADLLSLRSALDAEILSRPEWKEVIVPAGTWTVGVDIPSGFYCIKSTEPSMNLVELVNTSGDNELYKTFHEGEIVGKAEFKEGSIFSCYYSVILSPAVSLGF